jgi:hypothetical protein
MRPHLPHLRETVRTAIKSCTIQYRYNRRPDNLANARGVFTGGESVDDSVLIDRLIASYEGRAEHPTGQWADIYSERHADIREAFAANNRGEIQRILRDPVTSDIFYGFDPTGRSLRAGGLRIEDRHAPRLALDGLVTFAEAIGARPLEYPENYGLRSNPIAVEVVLDQIDRALGFVFKVPNPYRGEYGLASRRGVVGFRIPQALYQAWRIARLLEGTKHPRVLEIGGGLGRTAYYALAFGIRDYSIVDIPVSSLAQGYFLGRTLGADCVSLFGEPRPADAVKLLSPAEFMQGSERYDLIVNVDSLTEIGRKAADQYWREILNRADRFLSINHEANEFTVAQLIVPVKASRSPYWMRRGYVEEVVNLRDVRWVAAPR